MVTYWAHSQVVGGSNPGNGKFFLFLLFSFSLSNFMKPYIALNELHSPNLHPALMHAYDYESANST